MDISGTALHAQSGQDLSASPLHPLPMESSGEGNQHQDTLERHQTSGAVNHVDPACSPGNLSRPSALRNWISGDVSMHMSYLGCSPLVMVHGIPAVRPPRFTGCVSVTYQQLHHHAYCYL
jgi:hypothetical protein